MRLAPALAAVVASLSILGCGLTQSARFTRTDTLTEAHVAAAPLRVEVDNGAIAVERGGAGEVRITAEIKATTQERLDATRVLVTRDADATLGISVEWPDGRRLNNEGCTISITMPDAGTVVLTTSNGALTLDGVGTDAKLRTSNGRVTATGVPGGVVARTSNGRVTLTDIGGPVDADTSNGDLAFTAVGGPVGARTSNGSVDIRLAAGSAGPVAVHSSNGSARLAVGPAFAGELALSTSNGRVAVEGLAPASVDLRKSSGTVRFAGEGSSRVSTSNGSITVTAAGDE